MTDAERFQLDSWLQHNAHNKGHAATTVANYRAAVEQLSAWCESQRLVMTRITPEQVQKFAGIVLHERGLSTATRRVYVSALRGWFAWLVNRRLMSVSPCETLPYPKLGRNLPLPIPTADAEKILAQCDLDTFAGVRDVAILSVLIGCGPRVSGLVAMNEGDLIFAANEAGIEELVIRLREKGKHERYVPAPEETRLLVRAYLGHPELEEIDRRLPSGELVLWVNLTNTHTLGPDHRGEARRLTEWSIWNMIKGHGERAGVNPRHLHPHAFRHLYGQELAEGDVDLLIRQKLLGHADPKSTAIYSHIAFRKLRKAATDANPMKRIKNPASGLAAFLRGK